MVKDSVVVAEVHVVGANRFSLILLGEDLARLEDLRDEHRALTFRGRRKEMKILPDRSADRAGDPHVMLQARPPSGDRLLDEVFHDSATLRPECAAIA